MGAIHGKVLFSLSTISFKKMCCSEFLGKKSNIWKLYLKLPGGNWTGANMFKKKTKKRCMLFVDSVATFFVALASSPRELLCNCV